MNELASDTFFTYSEKLDFTQINDEFKKIGFYIEGLLEPNSISGSFKMGLAVVKSNLKKDQVKKILKRYWVKIVEYQGVLSND